MKTQTPTIVGQAADLAEFSAQGFGRRTLIETDRFRAVVVGLEDGQQIPVHAPQLDVVITVVEGVGRVMAGDRASWVRAGDVAVVPAGERRGLRAIGGRLVAINVVSPLPGDGDHAEAHGSWPVDEKTFDVAGFILKEHAGLLPHLDHLGTVAAASPEISEADLRSRLKEVLRFLREGLLPHAREEEVSVYPAAERVIRAVGGATRTMSIDHRFIGEAVDELESLAQGPLSDRQRDRIRRLLHGLEALLRVHFIKENEAYVPLLNRLAPDESRALYKRLAGDGDSHRSSNKES